MNNTKDEEPIYNAFTEINRDSYSEGEKENNSPVMKVCDIAFDSVCYKLQLCMGMFIHSAMSYNVTFHRGNINIKTLLKNGNTAGFEILLIQQNMHTYICLFCVKIILTIYLYINVCGM